METLRGRATSLRSALGRGGKPECTGRWETGGQGWKSEVRHGESVLRQIGDRIKPSKLDHPITVEEERGKTVSCLQTTGIFIQNET